jgi:hypothetical protein
MVLGHFVNLQVILKVLLTFKSGPIFTTLHFFHDK